MAGFFCPRCGTALAGTGEILECPACRGAFVDRHVVGALLESLREGSTPMVAQGGSPYRSSARPSAPPVEQDSRYLPCPMCAKLMNRTRLGGSKLWFVTDVCLAHGVWFDGGELASVAAVLGRSDQAIDVQVGQLLAFFVTRRSTTP